MIGERLWKAEELFPSQVQISINLNLFGIAQKAGELLEVSYVFSVNCIHLLNQIIKGANSWNIAQQDIR